MQSLGNFGKYRSIIISRQRYLHILVCVITDLWSVAICLHDAAVIIYVLEFITEVLVIIHRISPILRIRLVTIISSFFGLEFVMNLGVKLIKYLPDIISFHFKIYDPLHNRT